MTGGINVALEVDRNNRVLKTVWVLGDGQYEGLVSMEINGQQIAFDNPFREGLGNISSPSNYADRLKVWARLSGDGKSNNEFRTNYTLGEGVAYIVVEQSQPKEGDVFWERNDIPDVRFRVLGSRVNNTFTRNPATLAKWWLESRGIPTTIAPGTVEYCDELVATSGGRPEPRFRLSAVIEANEEIPEVIEVFERSMNGRIVLNPDGTATIHAGRAIATSATINKNDAIGEPVLQVITAPGDFFNEVTATTRVEPLWRPVEIKKTASSVNTDGTTVITKDLGVLRGIHSAAQAKRRLAHMLRRPQRMASVSLTLPLEQGIALSLWDRVRYVSPEVDGPFRVASHPVPNTLRNECSITLIEDPDVLYDDSEETVDLGPRRSVVARTVVPVPTGLSADSDALRQSDGSIIIQTGIQWGPPPPSVVRCEVRHRVSPSKVWIVSYDGDAFGYAVIPDTPAGSTIEIQAKFANRSERWSEWTPILSHVVTGDLEPPSEVTQFRTVNQIGGVLVQWSRPSDMASRDYKDAIVYAADSNDVGKALIIGSGFESFFDDRGTDLSTRYYWVRARDSSNNQSALVGPKEGKALEQPGSLAGSIRKEKRFRASVTRPPDPVGDTLVGWEEDPPENRLRQESIWIATRIVLQVNGEDSPTDWTVALFAPSQLITGDHGGIEDYNQIIYSSVNYRPLEPRGWPPAWDKQDGGISGSFDSDTDGSNWTAIKPDGDHWYSVRTVTKVTQYAEETPIISYEATRWTDPRWDGDGVPPSYRPATAVINEDGSVVVDEDTTKTVPIVSTPSDAALAISGYSGNVSTPRINDRNLVFDAGSFPDGAFGKVTVSVEADGYEDGEATLDVGIRNVLGNIVSSHDSDYEATISSVSQGRFDVSFAVNPIAAAIRNLTVSHEDMTVEDVSSGDTNKTIRVRNPQLRIALVVISGEFVLHDYHTLPFRFTLDFTEATDVETYHQTIYAVRGTHPGPVTSGWPIAWDQQDGGITGSFNSPPFNQSWVAKKPASNANLWSSTRVTVKKTTIIEEGAQVIEWEAREWQDPVWLGVGNAPPPLVIVTGLLSSYKMKAYQDYQDVQALAKFTVWPPDSDVTARVVSGADKLDGNIPFFDNDEGNVLWNQNGVRDSYGSDGKPRSPLGTARLNVTASKQGYTSSTKAVTLSIIAQDGHSAKLDGSSYALDDDDGNYYQLGEHTRLPIIEYLQIEAFNVSDDIFENPAIQSVVCVGGNVS